MNLFSYILQAGLKENHPSCDTRHCINRNQKRKQCRVCVEACPKQVYTEGQKERPQWNRCVNCGLCVSSCPARCIAPSTQNLEAQFAQAKQGECLRIACHETEGEADYFVPCLASIPWEMLAYMALTRPLAFFVGGCASCQNPERVKLVQRELGLLLQFLGEETYLKQVTLEFEKNESVEQEKQWSRRHLLEQVTKKTAQGARKLLADDNEERYDGLFYREMLADLIRERRTTEEGRQARYVVELPQMQANCYGCGNCVKLCPNQALEIGPEKDGKRAIYITPWRCTGCGVCVEICRDHAISGVQKMRVPHLDKLYLTEVASESCERCGRPMRPGALQPCAICRQKKR